MNDRSTPRPIMLSIAAVERDTGLSKDTLRVWERRYGFPAPWRDGLMDRAYPLDQVDKLRLIKRLMSVGHRPGRIVALPVDALQQLVESIAGAPQPPADAAAALDLPAYLDLIRSHDVKELRRELLQPLLRLGLSRFVTDFIAPLNTLVGDAWMRGHLEVFEEHLYTESVTVLLRQAIAGIPAAEGSHRPRVLLTTFPNESHGIGLLMAEALFLLEGCHCVSLGPQTPIWDIALAAASKRTDVVALAFTSVLTPAAVVEGLGELREKLPSTVEIWAGGSSPVLHRRPIAGVHALASLKQLGGEVQRWRTARP